jgi:hypothetical protein
MDDFRVGSVPSTDAYGRHQPSGSIARKREKHHGDEAGRQQDDTADTFEPIPASDTPRDTEGELADEGIEDYYEPSDPNADAE